MALASRTRDTASSTPKGDERRAAIQRALRELLVERRFAEITIAEITERAGVTRPAFYFYFPSKAAAVAELLHEVQEQMVRAAAAWYDGLPGSPKDRLQAGMRASIAEWRTNAALFAAMLDAAAADPTARAEWEEFGTAFIEKVTDRIDTDTGDRGGSSSRPTTASLATGLVTMVFALMEADVRSLLAGGDGVPDLEAVLVHVWNASIYQSS